MKKDAIVLLGIAIAVFFFYSDQLPDKPMTIKLPDNKGDFTIMPDDDIYEEVDELDFK